eukprot:scaffold15941_cov62-Isochrysis_galbana.AAC.1
MVGFTNLSAERSAEFMLGLLSDLFDKFDALTEMHHTHKARPASHTPPPPPAFCLPHPRIVLSPPPPYCVASLTR